MTFSDVRKKLFAGHAVPRRECLVCGEEIAYVMLEKQKTFLRSCSCRGEGKSRMIPLTWQQVQSLSEQTV